MNAEFVCELIRAHYDGDDERFAVIAGQLADSEAARGSAEVALRVRDLLRAGVSRREPPGPRQAMSDEDYGIWMTTGPSRVSGDLSCARCGSAEEDDLPIRRRADSIVAGMLDSAGNAVSGLDLTEISEDGHAVASLLWKVAGYLRRREEPS